MAEITLVRDDTLKLTLTDMEHIQYISPEIPALFLKQTPTPIDLDSIPDHKIG